MSFSNKFRHFDPEQAKIRVIDDLNEEERLRSERCRYCNQKLSMNCNCEEYFGDNVNDGWGNKTLFPDMFDLIIGYDDIKDYFRLALKSPDPIHILLEGPPASAKSLFLEILETLYTGKFISGNNLSNRGLADLILEEPAVLLMDEIEKVKNPYKDLAPLLTWMESGRVVITTHQDKIDKKTELNKWMVVAAANRTDKISPEILSRFDHFKLKPYPKEQFMKVITHVLFRLHETAVEYGSHIALRLIEKEMYNVRDAIRVARLIRPVDDDKKIEKIDFIINTKYKYS